MSIFYCVNCDKSVDSDVLGCQFNPLDKELETCVCEMCCEEIMATLPKNYPFK